jgi:hypothetical protein
MNSQVHDLVTDMTYNRRPVVKLLFLQQHEIYYLTQNHFAQIFHSFENNSMYFARPFPNTNMI